MANGAGQCVQADPQGQAQVSSGQASQVTAPPDVTTYVEGAVVGHASPQWQDTGEESRRDLNLELSRRRAQTVQQYFQEMLRNQMSSPKMSFSLPAVCGTSEMPEGMGNGAMGTRGVGSSETLQEAEGDVTANERSMRRVEISVALTHQFRGWSGRTEQDTQTVTTPEQCEDTATDQWAIKIALSGGAGHAGIGGAFCIGELKNRQTEAKDQGTFIGGGIGVGLQSPGADPGWGDWVNFQTDRAYTFEDFDDTLSRLTTAGAGAAIIGYSLAWISFPMLGANSIYVGGFNMGAVGADASSNVGNWTINGVVPQPDCTPTKTEERLFTRYVYEPYQYQVADNLRHTVYFGTGEARLSDEQSSQLQTFVQRLAAHYDPSY